VSYDLTTLFFALFHGYAGPPLGGVDFAALPSSGAGASLKEFADRLTGNALPAGENGPDSFLSRGAALVQTEMQELAGEESGMRLEGLADTLRASGSAWNPTMRRKLWHIFFPEGAALDEDRASGVEKLRTRRMVELIRLNEKPIEDPAREMLFTSNVLITVPDREGPEVPGTLNLPAELAGRIKAVMDEPQLYFYDHPIHIGVELDANEAVYGLKGMDRMMAFEKENGRASAQSVATVLLSLSVTHKGLHAVAADYLAAELEKAGPFEHLEVFLFTEPDAEALAEEVVAPFVPDSGALAGIRRVFGVDGEYGRHYSFLKALPALWSVFLDPGVRATFKIDLDQVFPQRELVEETRQSALEHFKSPLWGALGTDHAGNQVELGMIAGALVNEKDISRGLFTTDVPEPEEIPPGEAAVFFNKLPMALSTRAEMMTRYDGDPDGTSRCLQRYHVTGGTNGILIDALRRHRPFTPTFIGRAEDQAYILSVLFADGKPLLRYVHKPGLIMRHDKEAFAGPAIAAAEQGRFVGDLARTLLFTGYAQALPWSMQKTKQEIDPFSGCFVTRRRHTVTFLRLVLHAAALVSAGREKEAEHLLRLAERKLSPLLPGGDDAFDVAAAFREEKAAWNTFYDGLDRAEAEKESAAFRKAAAAAQRIVTAARRV